MGTVVADFRSTQSKGGRIRMEQKIEKYRFDFVMFGKIVFFLASAALFTLALSQYNGDSAIYVLFTAVSYLLLWFGFRQKSIFFDTFIGIFFWLGFWLKLTIRVAFMEGGFNQAVGLFDGSGAAFDQALLISSSGFVGLIAASLVREKLLFSYPNKTNDIHLQGLSFFYSRYRKSILTGFVALVVCVAISNVYYGFYQRGSISQTVLPYGLNGIYKWLLMFGLASFSALILKFEYFDAKKTTYLAAIISLIELFLSNVSLLSRGMILNGSALIYGVFQSVKRYGVKLDVGFFIKYLVLFAILFASSVVVVNTIRSITFTGQEFSIEKIKAKDGKIVSQAASSSSVLFLDRWVGIEGVMAVSSYSGKGWNLWNKAWQEQYSENETSFYDNNLITSPYLNTDKSKHHFISLPGIIAFCFYPGSYLFLFGCLFLSGIGASILELLVYKWGGHNLILCALLAQVVAFRFASFGYVPAQSYLLFGSILLNIVIIYLANKILFFWFKKEIKGN